MTDVDAILAALCKPSAAEEEEKDDEECGLVNCDPDDYYDGDEDEDEDEDYDSDYENWVEDTYSGYDIYERVRDLMIKLDCIKCTIEDDDYRYYPTEYTTLRDACDELEVAVKELNSAAYDYSTY